MITRLWQWVRRFLAPPPTCQAVKPELPTRRWEDCYGEPDDN